MKNTTDRICCDGLCEQGRNCPASNVIDFQNRAGLHRFFAPESGNSSGSVWIDLLTFWHITLPHVNWWPLIGLVMLLACSALVVFLLATSLPRIEWGHVLTAMWGAR